MQRAWAAGTSERRDSGPDVAARLAGLSERPYHPRDPRHVELPALQRPVPVEDLIAAPVAPFDALFVVVTPGHRPDHIVFPLGVPARLADTLDAVQGYRVSAYQDRYPTLLPVETQLSQHSLLLWLFLTGWGISRLLCVTAGPTVDARSRW